MKNKGVNRHNGNSDIQSVVYSEEKKTEASPPQGRRGKEIQ